MERGLQQLALLADGEEPKKQTKPSPKPKIGL